MMLVEVDLDNKDGNIVPGSFVTVALSLRHAAGDRGAGRGAGASQGKNASVFVLDGDTVHLRPVTVIDNDGSDRAAGARAARRRGGGV